MKLTKTLYTLLALDFNVKLFFFSVECQQEAIQTVMEPQHPRDLTLRIPSSSSMTLCSRKCGIRPERSDVLGKNHHRHTEKAFKPWTVSKVNDSIQFYVESIQVHLWDHFVPLKFQIQINDTIILGAHSLSSLLIKNQGVVSFQASDWSVEP